MTHSRFSTYFTQSLVRSLRSLVRRRIYLCMMVVAPLLSAFFFLDLMERGSVEQVPVGLVDLDGTYMSRSVAQNLQAMPQVKVVARFGSFNEAENAVKEGKIFGFIFIPEGLSSEALSGKQPTISYYINYAYFAPANMQFKGFKTITVLSNGAIARNVLQGIGVDHNSIMPMLQPVQAQVHALHNPWLNYSYYLIPSFLPCLFALLIMLTTCYSIGVELKYGSSVAWIRKAGGSMGVALVTKLLPQTIIFVAVGWVIQLLMYRVYWLPLNCPPIHMVIAMPLLVVANQAFALLIIEMVPNFRLSTTVCSLLGVLSFSFCGFSLPGEAMYPWIEAVGYIVPMKYYFLLTLDQALNGMPLYYSKLWYAALILYTIPPMVLAFRLKRECVRPTYVP